MSRVTYRLLSGVTTPGQALRRLIPPVGFASALINTTPIVAMLIPAAHELEQHSGVPARGVLLPIAHATTLAGSATLIGTSSNLLITPTGRSTYAYPVHNGTVEPPNLLLNRGTCNQTDGEN